MVKENFNRGWSFSRSSGTSFENLIPGTGASEEKVDLPHDASICTSRNPEEADGSGNGYFREENYVYRKQFELDADDVEKIVTLEFEGVYQKSITPLQEIIPTATAISIWISRSILSSVRLTRSK